MNPKFKPFRCAECGDLVKQKAGPGRKAEYRRGLDLAVPDDFAIPTCQGCGETYLTLELGEALAKRQAPLFAAWQKGHCGALVTSIRERHSVTLRQIEGACGVTATYLSHVLAGRKEASLTLIRLLEAYAHAPSEFARQLRGDPWKESPLFERGSIAWAIPRDARWQPPGAPLELAPPLAANDTQAA